MPDIEPHHLILEGMTCAHCVRAVTQAVAAIPGAENVSVDLASGGVTWQGTAALPRVVEAVEREGYTVRAQTPQ